MAKPKVERQQIRGESGGDLGDDEMWALRGFFEVKKRNPHHWRTVRARARSEDPAV
jgi:hypothetical protein